MGAVHFHDELVEMLPRLRRIAVAMTRNRSRADDLVQDTVVKALAASDSFAPGTNLGAWLYRILRNQFISDCRRTRRTVPIEDACESILSRNGSQESTVVAKELLKMLDRIPVAQSEALLLVTIEGLSYEDVARYTGCSIGTAKSRVFRAREQLSALLQGQSSDETVSDQSAQAPAVAALARAGQYCGKALGSLASPDVRDGGRIDSRPSPGLGRGDAAAETNNGRIGSGQNERAGGSAGGGRETGAFGL